MQPENERFAQIAYHFKQCLFKRKRIVKSKKFPPVSLDLAPALPRLKEQLLAPFICPALLKLSRFKYKIALHEMLLFEINIHRVNCLLFVIFYENKKRQFRARNTISRLQALMKLIAKVNKKILSTSIF